MLKNYFRAALRNLYRQRGVSFINLLGLTSASLLLLSVPLCH